MGGEPGTRAEAAKAEGPLSSTQADELSPWTGSCDEVTM